MFKSSNAARLIIRMAMALFLVCAGFTHANAQVFYWGPNPFNDDWHHIFNWNLGFIPNTTSAGVVIDGDYYNGSHPQLDGNVLIGGLTLRDLGRLTNWSHNLIVNPGNGTAGRTNIQDGGTLQIGSSGVFDTDELNIDGTLINSGLVQVDKKAEIRSGGLFSGSGTLQMAGSEFLYNEGTIRASGYLEINRLGSSKFNWDGLTENGRLEVTSSSTLFVNMPPADIFSGVISIDGGTFRTQTAWSLGGAGALLSMNDGFIQGGAMTIMEGSLASGYGQFNVAVDVQGGQLQAVNGTLRLSQNTTTELNSVVAVGSNSELKVESNFDHMGDMTSWGSVKISPSGDFVMLDGTMNIAGMLEIEAGGIFEVVGGRLEADTVEGDLNVAGGVLVIDDFEQTPGQMTINGNYTCQAASTLEIDLGSTYDQLIVNGDVSLAGALNVRVLEPLSVGQQFTIIDAIGDVTGQFEGLANGARVGTFGNVKLIILYGDNTVTLVAKSLLESTPAFNRVDR